jgi:hypothetical protein
VNRLALAAVLLAAGSAAADPPKPRPFRWSIGAGTALLFTGLHDGPRNRADAHLDLDPGGRFGRFGLLLAARQLTFSPFAADGMLTAGLKYEAAAARPRLALALHADAGVTLSDHAPVVGGGLETHLWIWPSKLGPLAVVFDLTGELVLSSVDDTRLVLSTATRLAVAF